MKEKACLSCGEDLTKGVFCFCREIKEKGYHKAYYKNHIKRYKDEEYVDEFLRVTSLGGKCLTKKGFDESSSISSMSIVKGLKLSWKELLIKYNLMEKIYEYAVEEYQSHAYLNGKANSTAFTKEHPYLRQYLFDSVLDIKLVRKKCGFINDYYAGQYNEYLLKKHFNEVKNKINKIPTCTEFLKHGDILPSIYCDYYGIEGQKWDDVLKKMDIEEQTLNQFLYERDEMYKEYAVKSLRKYKKENDIKIPEVELETEFRRVFDYYFENFGTHPTRRIFNRDSIYNDMTYRKRLKMRWSEVAVYYGYKIKERNVSEKIFLELLKQITHVDYQRNKTWSWLLGESGKHLYCDGYFQELNLVTEFDGKQHRTPVSNFGGKERYLKDIKNDATKEKLVKEKGYKFLRVSSKEKWMDKEYLKKKLNDLGVRTV